MLRREKIDQLKSWLNIEGRGLELGPHVNPMFRKSDGYNVAYLETRGTDALRELMRKQGRDPAIVEDIDYILERDKRLPEIVGGTTFDWVASSHVIEHIPDLVGHLVDVSAVLKERGCYALMVPDRNYCFDCLKPASSLGSVIEAHLLNRQSGSIESMVNEWRYAARPEGVKIGGWGEHAAKRPLVPKHENWTGRVKAALQKGETSADDWYGHQWRFDPPLFADVLADLIDLDLIDLELRYISPTHDMDFLVVLSKTQFASADAVRKIGRMVAAGYRVPSYTTLSAD